ncbi:hypothetical protein [Rhodohalobacter sp. 8-1]|uniref:hypothetical protein n=1 Tax=Rhodohalobacter sp. 8-1 TaxID=3131972 RepID=UPI0030ED8ECC
MSDWLKQYQKAWQSVHVENIDERLRKLREVIKEDQKKDRLSTIWMSLAFIIAIGIILWVAVSNNFSSLTSWTTVAGMVALMLLTGFLRIKAITTAPDPGKPETEHLNKLIASYSLRLKMQRQYLWIYLTVLNLLLIVFYADSYYPENLKTLIWATLATIGYSLLVVIIMNKKRKKDIKFMSGVIDELKSIRRDLKE